MSQSLRIFWIAGPGGHDWIFHPIEVLQEQGHKVELFCVAGTEAATKAQQKGLRTRALAFPGKIYDLPEIARTIGQLKRCFQAEQPDVVYYYMIPISFWARIAAWLARVPVRVYKPAALWDLDIPVYRLMEGATAWMDTTILASCRTLESFYGRWPWTRKKTMLSYNGIPVAGFDPREASTVREEFGIRPHHLLVTMISYLVPPLKRFNPYVGIKGHEVLIQAARIVVSQNATVRFLIVGDEPAGPDRGAYLAKLRQMVQELRLGEEVIFAGYRRDVAQILAAADLAVVPSLSENVGGAVEPLLMEKPVVASDVGGLPDVVIDGETGYLVPPADAEALGTAILRMLALPAEQRQAMGKRGRQVARDLFDIRQVVEREVAAFEQVLAKARGELCLP